MKRRATWLALAALTLCVALGMFAPHVRDEPPRGTREGTDLGALVSEDSSVVVVFNPANCFRCDDLMPMWLKWAQMHPKRLAIVLTREPTKDERLQMESLKIPLAGVLVKPRFSWLLGIRYNQKILLYFKREEVGHEEYGPVFAGTPIQKYVRDEIQLALDADGHLGSASAVDSGKSTLLRNATQSSQEKTP